MLLYACRPAAPGHTAGFHWSLVREVVKCGLQEPMPCRLLRFLCRCLQCQ